MSETDGGHHKLPKPEKVKDKKDMAEKKKQKNKAALLGNNTTSGQEDGGTAPCGDANGTTEGKKMKGSKKRKVREEGTGDGNASVVKHEVSTVAVETVTVAMEGEGPEGKNKKKSDVTVVPVEETTAKKKKKKEKGEKKNNVQVIDPTPALPEEVPVQTEVGDEQKKKDRKKKKSKRKHGEDESTPGVDQALAVKGDDVGVSNGSVMEEDTKKQSQGKKALVLPGSAVEEGGERKKKKMKGLDAMAMNGTNVSESNAKESMEGSRKEKKRKVKEAGNPVDDLNAKAAAPGGVPEPDKAEMKVKGSKKRKLDEMTKTDTVDTDQEENEEGGENAAKRSCTAEEADDGGAARPFQRVKADEWLDKKGSWNNSYEATFGQGGWGFKAQQVLGQVRGKDFRHEKTKKKRGSYRGGAIDPSATFSYKFDSDDE